MKHSRICVKCGSDRLVKVPHDSFMGQMGVGIPLGIMSTAVCECYVCCSCGYAELWVPEKKLDKLYEEYGWTRKQNWSKNG